MDAHQTGFIHCSGHQKGTGPIQRGNNLADQTAWWVALQTDSVLLAQALVDPEAPSVPEHPDYSQEDLAWIKAFPMAQNLNGWWRSGDHKLILPEKIGNRLKKMHCSSHMGVRRMQDLIRHSKLRTANRKSITSSPTVRHASLLMQWQIQKTLEHSSEAKILGHIGKWISLR